MDIPLIVNLSKCLRWLHACPGCDHWLTLGIYHLLLQAQCLVSPRVGPCWPQCPLLFRVWERTRPIAVGIPGHLAIPVEMLLLHIDEARQSSIKQWRETLSVSHQITYHRVNMLSFAVLVAVVATASATAGYGSECKIITIIILILFKQ